MLASVKAARPAKSPRKIQGKFKKSPDIDGGTLTAGQSRVMLRSAANQIDARFGCAARNNWGETVMSQVPSGIHEPAVARYHPFLVTLHWLLAFLIILMLVVGFFVLARMPDTAPDKIFALRIHMIIGLVILALMTLRLIIRLFTKKPPTASTGHRGLDVLAHAVHWAFYLLVLLMVSSGLTTAVLSGLNLIVFGGVQAPFPPDLTIYPSFIGHIVIAFLLTALIVLHIAAALYHQTIRGDGLLQRMWFGRR
jgi:cytochrome b561